MRFVTLISVCAISNFAHAADIVSDPLLAKVYGEAKQYEKTTFATTMGWTTIAKGQRIDRILKYDPAKPAGQQWQYISRNGKPPEAKFLKDMAVTLKNEVPDGYSTAADILHDNRWTKSGGNDTSAEYTLAIDEKSKVIVDETNMARYLKTVMTIQLGDRPYIKSLTMMAPAPFSPRSGSSVKSMAIEYVYARRNDELIFLQSDKSKVDFKILFSSTLMDEAHSYETQGPRVPVQATLR